MEVQGLVRKRKCYRALIVLGCLVCGFLFSVVAVKANVLCGSSSMKLLTVENLTEDAEFWDVSVRLAASSKEERVPLLLTLKGDTYWYCIYDRNWGGSKEFYGSWLCWMSYVGGNLEFPYWWARGYPYFKSHRFNGKMLVELTFPRYGAVSKQALLSVQKDWADRDCLLERDLRPGSSFAVADFHCVENATEMWGNLRVRLSPHSSVCLESASQKIVGLETAKVDVTGETLLQFNREDKKMRQVPLKENFLMIL